MDFLNSFNDSALVVFLRESLWTYPILLAIHAIGMAFIVGVNAAIDLRILGFAPLLPLKPMEKYFPVMWVGFWLNALSGGVLLLAFAEKNLSDPVFYVKLGFIVLAAANLRLLHHHVFQRSLSAVAVPVGADAAPLSRNVRMLAATSLVFWAGAIVTGRLMAYHWFRFWE